MTTTSETFTKAVDQLTGAEDKLLAVREQRTELENDLSAKQDRLSALLAEKRQAVETLPSGESDGAKVAELTAAVEAQKAAIVTARKAVERAGTPIEQAELFLVAAETEAQDAHTAAWEKAAGEARGKLVEAIAKHAPGANSGAGMAGVGSFSDLRGFVDALFRDGDVGRALQQRHKTEDLVRIEGQQKQALPDVPPSTGLLTADRKTELRLRLEAAA